MKTRHLLAALAITALLTGSALGYTYSVWKDDLARFKPPSYSTIIPWDGPLRNNKVPAILFWCACVKKMLVAV